MFYRLEFFVGTEWVGYWKWMRDYFDLDMMPDKEYAALCESDWFVKKYGHVPCRCEMISQDLRDKYPDGRCWFTEAGFHANEDVLVNAMEWAAEHGIDYRFPKVEEVPGKVVYESTYQVFVVPC